MKKTLLALSFLPALAFTQQAPPPTTWSGSIYYDVNLRHADAVVFNKIGDLTVHGKSIGIEADGFVGAANVKGSPAVVGISLLWHHQLVDQIQIVFGVGGSMTGGKWGGGPILGLGVKF